MLHAPIEEQDRSVLKREADHPRQVLSSDVVLKWLVQAVA